MRFINKFLATTVLAAGTTIVAAGAVFAQTAPAPGNPSTQQMIDQLKPHTRGLIIGGGSAPAPAASPAPAPVMTAPTTGMAAPSRPAAPAATASAPQPYMPPTAMANPAPATAPAPAATAKPSLNLRVLFAFNSADLTPEARTTLDNLGKALQSNDLKNSRFEVAGHTDSVGDDQANQKLSQDRAAAVKNYLVSTYGIDPSRIQSVGYGKAELFDPAHPTSSVNRRVQVTNLSAAG